MKRIIDRLFRRSTPPKARTRMRLSAVSSELTHSDIETYYLRVVTDSLRRMMVPPDSVELSVRRTGAVFGGIPQFAGYVRILRWDAVTTPVLLQNLPVIDSRVRKVVEASVLLEKTRFAGLWFQATDGVIGAPTALVGMPAELVRQSGWPGVA